MIRKCFSAVPVITGILLFAGCEDVDNEKKGALRPVRCLVVSKSGMDVQRSFSGVSKAAMEVHLSFKIGGTVKDVKVKVGDKIKKGTIVATIDKHDYRLMYEQATVSLSNARIQMQSAKSAFDRTAALYENSHISLQDYEKVKSGYESAKAIMETSKRSKRLAERQLQYTILTAPMDGVVADVTVENNENVAPGQTVVEINSGNEIEVTIGIPEVYISHIREGDKASVVFSALGENRFNGVVSEVAFGISSKSSSYPVSIVLDNPSEDIRPGMAAEATLNFTPVADSSSRVVVPVHAIAEDQEGRFVYTVRKTDGDIGSIVRKSIETGALTKMGMVVTEGLNEGDVLVTAGISRLTDGMSVKLMK